MRILLINPNSSLISKSWAYRRFFTPIAPLGLAYLAAVLQKKGFETVLIDQFATGMSDGELIEFIKHGSFSVIGFSALTPVIPDIRRIVRGIREARVNAKIILGNIHSSCFPEEVLKEGIADIVVRGEGEMAMLDICQAICRGDPLDGIGGINFKADNKIVHAPDRDPIVDIDTLPFPAWHLLRLDDYTEVPLAAINKSRALPIIASRGCTYRCYYCSQDKIYHKVRYRNLYKVVDEMEYFHHEFNIKFFGFSDAYFPWDEKSGLEFCSLLIKRGLNRKLKWCTETRVDKVSKTLLEAMKESGAHLIMYGVEVGSKNILDSLGKHTTLDQARAAFKHTRKAGILSQGLFILGLPGENEHTCLETIRFAKELDCDIAKFNIAMPYPGSRFFEDYRNSNNNHKPETFTSWLDWTTATDDFVYVPKGMDSVALRYLQRKAMLEFYLRPRVIIRHIIKKTISLKNIFYGGIWLIRLFVDYRRKIKQRES